MLMAMLGAFPNRLSLCELLRAYCFYTLLPGLAQAVSRERNTSLVGYGITRGL